MGRRKIEIQPITHERNRSVTFLKRKNGLFKKAYELGVLCSVDVAVIIFEERPGHHLKLYQYCSTDIHDIVQRHLRHDGEKDTRGPQDFAGNVVTKMDNDDGDDDDVDDEDDPVKRRPEPKIKRSELTMPNDLDYQRGMSIPQPLHMPGIPSSSTHPISSDRLRHTTHPHHSKRPRTDLHSRSPSDDMSSGSGYYNPTSYTRTGGNYQSSGGQYTPLYPVPSQTTSPPVFIPLHPNPPSRSAGSNGPPSSTFPPGRSSSHTSNYNDNMYPGMMRPPQSAPHHPSGGGGGGGGSGAGAGGMFNAFLDADEHSRQSQGQQGFGLDWPVHESNAPTAPPGPNSGSGPLASHSANTSSGAGGEGSNWLDFLSGNPNAAPSGRDPSMSWERSGGDNRGDISEMFNSGSGGGGGGGQTSPMVGIGGIGKRARVGSEVEDVGGLSSPNGVGEKKDMKSEGGG